MSVNTSPNADEMEQLAIEVERVFGSQARWVLASYFLSDSDDRQLIFEVLSRIRTAGALLAESDEFDEDFADRLFGSVFGDPPD